MIPSLLSRCRRRLILRCQQLVVLAGAPALLGACPGTLGPGMWPTETGGRNGLGTGGMSGDGTGGGPGLGTGGMAADCPDVPTVMAASCGTAVCHPTFGDFARVDGLAIRLINQDSLWSPSCNGQRKLVNPSKPASGVLIERLTTDTCSGAPGVPGRMPPDTTANINPRPPANFAACVKTWLEGQL